MLGCREAVRGPPPLRTPHSPSCTCCVRSVAAYARVQLEVRGAASGEVLFRDQLHTAVVDVAVADVRGDGGTAQVLAVLASGDVRGYVTVAMSSLSRAMQDERDCELLQQARLPRTSPQQPRPAAYPAVLAACMLVNAGGLKAAGASSAEHT